MALDASAGDVRREVAGEEDRDVADLLGPGHPAERDGRARSRRPGRRRRSGRRCRSVRHRPTSIELTRTFGPHSTASDEVSESRPAFAAPYAAVPGEGRVRGDRGDVDDRAAGLLAAASPRWRPARTAAGASRLRPTILSWKRAEASAARAYGAPPALLTSTSSRPCVGDDLRRPGPGPPRGPGRRRRSGRSRLDLRAGAGDAPWRPRRGTPRRCRARSRGCRR